MIDLQADVAIVGSGFGGSVTALLLERAGLRPVLIERGRHPRLALGESSTPLANLLLQHLGQRYDLPQLVPFGEYGSWQAAYPQLACGLKRGFSYFKHEHGRAFTPRNDRGNELLFAASATSDDADMHWYRPDFDHFLVREVQAAGIPYFDRTEVTATNDGQHWTLQGNADGEPLAIRAEFLIDASGDGGFVCKSLGISREPVGMQTHSRVVFGHFADVGLWSDLYAAQGGKVDGHPFPCDDAALHHIIDGGWMYVLRFNNGVTSAGFMLDTRLHPVDESLSADDEWHALLGRYPSVQAQFVAATITPECERIRRTPRLQRRAVQTAGPNWALLPFSAYGLDALHSTGNAHTLCGVERLVQILEQRLPRDARTAALQAYDRTLQSEIDTVDEIVHGCYSAFSRFDLLVSYAMFYFAAATVSEHARRKHRRQTASAFLLSGDPEFRQALRLASGQLQQVLQAGPTSRSDEEAYGRFVAGLLQPYNIAGLCDPARQNMYPFLKVDYTLRSHE